MDLPSDDEFWSDSTRKNTTLGTRSWACAFTSTLVALLEDMLLDDELGRHCRVTLPLTFSAPRVALSQQLLGNPQRED